MITLKISIDRIIDRYKMIIVKRSNTFAIHSKEKKQISIFPKKKKNRTIKPDLIAITPQEELEMRSTRYSKGRNSRGRVELAQINAYNPAQV